MDENKNIMEIICEKTEEKLEEIKKAGITNENLDNLSKLVDIHKDIKNEYYWKEKIEMYRNYGYDEYSDYGRRDSRGRYMDDSYGRRGVPGSGRRYRGEDMIDKMRRTYNDYMDGAEYGNYGTGESMQKIEIMANSLMDFVDHLKKEAKTPEERQLIDQKIQELSRM